MMFRFNAYETVLCEWLIMLRLQMNKHRLPALRG